jgi:hypothetical protein
VRPPYFPHLFTAGKGDFSQGSRSSQVHQEDGFLPHLAFIGRLILKPL